MKNTRLYLVTFFVFVLSEIPTAKVVAQTISEEIVAKSKPVEGLVVDGGVGAPDPSLATIPYWSVEILYRNTPTFFCFGLSGQGTYDGYAPAEQPKPNQNTLDLVLNGSLANWKSRWRGTGGEFFCGPVFKDRRTEKTFHYGCYGNVAYNFDISKNIGVGFYARVVLNDFATALDQHGSEGYSLYQCWQINWGARVGFKTYN